MQAKLFVSYSRKDSDRAKILIERFEGMGYDVWVDWDDIKPATNWMEEVELGIEGADAFIFFISPDSITSEVCGLEVNHAAKYNKRIIPVVLYEVPAKATSTIIRELNWIFMREKDDLEKAFLRFKDAVELDFAWLAEHNSLMKKTLEWHHGKTTSLLLYGFELHRVRRVVHDAKNKEPKLIKLQERFLLESVKNERRRYIFWSVVSIVIAVLAGLTYFAVQQKNLAVDNAIIASQNAEIANKNADVALQNEREARRSQLIAEEQRVLAEQQKEIAVNQALIAKAQRSAARAQIYQSQPGELYTSTLLGLASYETYPSDESNEILRKNISLLPIPVAQMHHEGRINSLEFNKSGDLFVTGGADGKACVWRASDGEMLFCATSPKSVNDAVFSPNGKYLVTGDDSGRVQIILVEDGSILQTFEAGAVINDIAVSSKNDQIAVARKDGRVTLLELQTAKRKYDLQAFGSLKLVSFSPNDTYVAAGSSSGSVTLWDLETGKAVSSGRHKGEVLALAFSPNSRYLITGGQDGYVVAARVFDGQEAYRLLHEDWVKGITFSADGAWFATVSNDKRIRLWDTADGTERLRMVQDNFVYAAKISSNGQWIASTGEDRTVRVWNASTGTEMFQIPLRSAGLELGFSGDASRLVAGDANGGIYIWDISVMPVPENYIQFGGLVDAVQFSPSGDWVAASDGPRVWLLRPGQLSTLTNRSLTNPTFTLNGNVTNIVFSLDSTWLAASTENGQVFVYNVQTRQSKTLFQTGLQYQLAFSSNNETLIVSGLENVQRWNLVTSRVDLKLAENGSGIVSVAASPSLVALGQTDKITLLSLEGERVGEIDSPGDHLLLSFSADGSLLASSNSAGLIEVWRMYNDTYELVGSIRKETVYSVAFTPDGSQLAVGAAGLVYLLDTVSVDEIARIPHAGNVTGVSYAIDGKTLATTSLRSLQLWDMSKTQKIYESTLVQDACSRLTANFTEAQWSNFFGDDPYQVLCEGK